MAEELRVVAHYVDGSVRKGTVIEFSTSSPTFLLRERDNESPLRVPFAELKAAFFVKDLKGRSQRKNIQGFMTAAGGPVQGMKIAVQFKDGEVLCGYSYTHTVSTPGFFMFPADTASNNLRVYVIRDSTIRVAIGAAAELLVREAARRRIA